jgi:DNA-binding MarR family transcriptional regulator
MTAEIHKQPRQKTAKPSAPVRLDLRHFVPYRLSLLGTLVQRAMGEIYRRRPGLTEPEWKVMTILAHYGPVPSGDIGRYVTIDRVAVSRALSRLMRRGLAVRSPHESDKRMFMATLSPMGSRLYDRLAREVADLGDAVVQGLNASEVAQMLMLFDKIEQHFRAYVKHRPTTLVRTVDAIVEASKLAKKRFARR